MFFKGYVLTANKQCTEKFKDKKKFKTLEQVSKYPEYAGILDTNTILVDIDDEKQSDIMFDIVQKENFRCRVYKTTRGKHFLFSNASKAVKKCGTHLPLAIGLEADIKIGSKNSYEVLKFNDEEREILYDTAGEDENADELPQMFIPLQKKSKYKFHSMESGDGRNSAFFSYILTLQNNGFSVDEARDCIRAINEYVVSEPLTADELEVILRDAAFQKPNFFEGRTFLFNDFADYIRNNNHIVKIEKQLHIYHDGVYIAGDQPIENAMIETIPQLRRAQRSEVLSYLDIMIHSNERVEEANLIAFENGLYDLISNKLVEFSPAKIITNKIHWNYNSNAYSEIADKVLNKISCGDMQVRALLEEIIGYCFYRRNELGKAFILTGDKSNGKSTYLAMVQKLLNYDNISSLDLKEIDMRFKTAELFGKLANIGDDIGDEFIPNPSMFKKIVTGDRISAERKGRDPFEFNPYCKLLFSANNIPRIKDKTGAVQRRLLIVPFDARFSVNDPDYDPYIKHKLMTYEVMEYLITLGIKGLQRILMNRSFTTSEKIRKAIKEYEENNNPILGFFKECELEGFKIENEPTKNVYLHYKEYCIGNMFQPISKIEFSKQVNRILNFHVVDKTISGKKHRIFVRN